ncbi:MAG TPA: MgtC/SapB family protein [Phycisphaerae bacterium]|nr:MgtC/SapB family protein [Phycisphaerae bacterium]HNU45723.1 MgtC/SapB family protein [Phycisphaerae bacterium]
MPEWSGELLGREFTLSAEHAVRLLIALLLGGVIGIERELRDKPAGLRTMILICVGAALFTIISEEFGPPIGERTRIAAQIVTGVGFLGAGAILREGNYIFGLTTAATIWAVSAVGMAVGFGRIALGAFATCVILISLLAFHEVQRWLDSLRDLEEYIIATRNTDEALQRVYALFADARLRMLYRNWHEEGNQVVFTIRAMGTKRRHEQLRWNLVRSTEYTLRRGTMG